MKKIVSVSLGSSKRNHTVTVELLGEQFEISRIGTDGDFQKAMETLRRLDGKVNAIGLGGIDVYLYAGNKRYAIKDGMRLLKTVKQTPVVDGSGLKNTLEREAINYLAAEGYLKPGDRVLMTSALDRFGMAQALVALGCDVTFGDLMFAVGVPYPIKSISRLENLANKLLPIFIKLPFKVLYPTGSKQERNSNARKYEKYYQQAKVIAGDFHFIKKYLPQKLNGQIIITNTTTADDVKLLAARGMGTLITTTPVFNGRSFGTNVMEAVLLAILGKRWEEVTPEDYLGLLKKLEFKPQIIPLNPLQSSYNAEIKAN